MKNDKIECCRCGCWYLKEKYGDGKYTVQYHKFVCDYCTFEEKSAIGYNKLSKIKGRFSVERLG